jgi:hypothetical protein
MAQYIRSCRSRFRLTRKMPDLSPGPAATVDQRSVEEQHRSEDSDSRVGAERRSQRLRGNATSFATPGTTSRPAAAGAP